MSYVIAAPEQVQAAAQDLAGIRSLLAEAAAGASAPTTAILPAAADEVSAAISAMFGSVGQNFQSLSAQAQAFHAAFVNAMNASAGAYLSAELANAGAILTSELVPAGAGAATAQSVSAAGLLGGILGGGSGGGLVGGLTGGPGGLGGLVGSLGSLGGLNSLLSGALPGLTGVVNSLLPGLVNIQTGAGPFFTGIAGPYEALFYHTWNNLNSLTAGWLADPFPFLRQFVANQMGYGQIIATALQTGNFQPVAAIPGDIGHNLTNVVGTLTNTSVTSSLVVQSLALPPALTLDNAVGLPLVFGASLLGPPVTTLEAAGYSASLFTSAIQAGNPAGAIAALIDAPAYIADGFLNGQATYPYALNLSSLTGPAIGSIANVTVVANFPLDGILHPPGYYPVTATITLLNNTLVGPVNVNLGAGSTPFSGLLPFLVNYAPQQLAQAIGAPASPPPLISLPLLTF